MKDDYNVLVKFGSGIDADTQGVFMLMAEKWFRTHGIPACVLKETMADDSKLRNLMTLEVRDKL